MSHTLLVTPSPRGADSLSTRFATEIAEGIQVRTGGPLTVRDLAANPPPHITRAYIQGRITAPEDRTPEQVEAVNVAQTFVDELKAADVIVLGSGMMNFGPPSQLKAWFDHVTWPRVTFSYCDAGPKGLLTGKKVYLVTATGGVFSEGAWAPFDFQTNYLLHPQFQANRRSKTDPPGPLSRGDLQDQHAIAKCVQGGDAVISALSPNGLRVDASAQLQRRDRRAPGDVLARAFITWCDERGVTRPQEVTRPVLERYQRYLFLYRKQNG